VSFSVVDEKVATQGNFLIDSQMQLVGNPSLIDPTKVQPKMDEGMSEEVIAAFAELSEEDRRLAESQRICPVTEMLLGSMGAPLKVDVDGTPVFICCEGCRDGLLDESGKYLAILANKHSSEESDAGESMDLPPISAFEIVEPSMELPLIGAVQAIMEDDQESGQPVAELPTGVIR